MVGIVLFGWAYWALWGKSKSLWMRYIPRERFLILLGDTYIIYIYIYIYIGQIWLYESAAFIIWNRSSAHRIKLSASSLSSPLCFLRPTHTLSLQSNNLKRIKLEIINQKVPLLFGDANMSYITELRAVSQNSHRHLHHIRPFHDTGSIVTIKMYME